MTDDGPGEATAAMNGALDLSQTTDSLNTLVFCPRWPNHKTIELENHTTREPQKPRTRDA